jgi:hypothetical protein
MKKLTLAEYYALPHPERTLLRRLAFGWGAPPECFVPAFDIDDLRTKLLAENEANGEFPVKWTATVDDVEDLADEVPDVVDAIRASDY